MIDDEENSGLPVFLERRSYRRRRLHDAARLLPVLGLLGWMVPLLWPVDSAKAPASSNVLTYVFLVWAVLIGACFVVSSRLARNEANRDAATNGDERESRK